MKNVKLSFNLNSIPRFFFKLRGFLITLAIIGVFGFTLYQISQVATTQPDHAYLDAQRQDMEKKKVKFDQKTLQAIENLNSVSVHLDTPALGKTDPFSP